VSGTDVFCEACGHQLTEPVTAVAPAPVGKWVTSAGPPRTCAACGGTVFGPEGYCEACGQRRPHGKDHTELELGDLAAVTDKGHRHARNEDAVGLGLHTFGSVAVVCDGVSSSTRPDAASNAAIEAALEALVEALDRGVATGEAIGGATGAAQAAATLAAGPQPGANPPASTFVCAVVERDSVTVGWVGDSRAYWLPDGDGEPLCLTVDDSMAAQFAARGVGVPSGVPHAQAVALVRWLGADATDTAPHLRTISPAGPGRVLVCSDGLFRYRPAATDLAASTPRVGPLETAQRLVRLALDAGGVDNIAVAVLAHPPTSPTSVHHGQPQRTGVSDE
jgi:serine/threonine protein phosphatase PrpC